ncbi:MAG: hypothetical protein EA426_17470, partial [Spirochaetaceae bacterium]
LLPGVLFRMNDVFMGVLLPPLPVDALRAGPELTRAQIVEKPTCREMLLVRAALDDTAVIN